MVPIIRAWSTHGTAAVVRISSCLLFAFGAATCVARADVQTIDGASMPIVRVNVKQGNVTIRTWDKEIVQIDADPALEIVRRTTDQSGAPYPVPIPDIAQNSAEGVAEFPAENFVATLAPGPHDVIIVRDAIGTRITGPTPVTVTIPRDSAFVFARTGNGILDARGYRSGTFVGFVGRGRMVLGGMGGTVFAQTVRGPLIVTNSSFDRFRGRSLFGNVTFDRCDARQIETTTIYGSIVYDRGTFEPGLARFEAERGDIAIGTDAPAELGGHAAGDGHVYTNFQHATRIDGHDSDESAIVGGGGPVVTAMTQSGNVFFYDGSLRSREQLAPQWQAPIEALRRPGIAIHREGALRAGAARIPDYRQSPPLLPKLDATPRAGDFEGRRNRAHRRGRRSIL